MRSIDELCWALAFIGKLASPLTEKRLRLLSEEPSEPEFKPIVGGNGWALGPAQVALRFSGRSYYKRHRVKSLLGNKGGLPTSEGQARLKLASWWTVAVGDNQKGRP